MSKALRLPDWTASDIDSFKVESCSDGSLRVYPAWTEHATFEPDSPGEPRLPPGLLSRTWIAAQVERVLNEALARAKRRVGANR